MYYRENGNVITEQFKPKLDVKENFELDTSKIDVKFMFYVILVIILLILPTLIKDKNTNDFVYFNYFSKLIIIIILWFILNDTKC